MFVVVVVLGIVDVLIQSSVNEKIYSSGQPFIIHILYFILSAASRCQVAFRIWIHPITDNIYTPDVISEREL